MATPGSRTSTPPSPASKALASGRNSLVASYLAPGGALAHGKGFDRANSDLLDWFLAERLAEGAPDKSRFLDAMAACS